MRILLTFFFTFVSLTGAAAPLREVSNLENTEKKHQQVLASRLMSWPTGSMEQREYISVGRYANFFGFVKFRVSSDHSLSRSGAALESLSLLTEPQTAQLLKLLERQRAPLRATHQSRLAVNDFLDHLLLDEKNDTDKNEFLLLARHYALEEAKLGILLAEEFSAIINTFDNQQIKAFQTTRNKYTSGTAEKFKFNAPWLKALNRNDKQQLINLAARLLSWVSSDLQDLAFETVGKPSQHFGFVSMRIESNRAVRRGKVADDVLNILDPQQSASLSRAASIDEQHFQQFLKAREPFLDALTHLRHDTPPSTNTLLELASDVANAESRMTWAQATALKALIQSLSSDQINQLITMRQSLTGSPVIGEQLFKQCAMCHQNNAVAPNLSGIVNRAIASHEFNYSPAMRLYANDHGTWSKERLAQFIKQPGKAVPGTTMGYKGLESNDSVNALLEYLQTID